MAHDAFERGKQAGRQEATLETIQGSLDDLHIRLFGEDGQGGALGHHERRISRLEGWRNMLAGAWALLTAGLIGGHHGG